jgi:hypothetical protein
MTCAQIAEKHPAEHEARKKAKLRYRWDEVTCYHHVIVFGMGVRACVCADRREAPG